MTVPIYYCEKLDIYGLVHYQSAFTSRFQGKDTATDEGFLQAQWITNFKTHGRQSDKISLALETLKEHFNCQIIVPVVSSKAEPTLNPLQKMYGNKYLKRLENVAKAKYNQGGAKNGVRTEGFRPETCFFGIEELKNDGINRILLVDDICKTGETMIGIRQPFLDAGIEVVSLVLGLSYKLIPHKVPYHFFGADYAKNKQLLKPLDYYGVTQEGIDVSTFSASDVYKSKWNRIPNFEIDIPNFVIQLQKDSEQKSIAANNAQESGYAPLFPNFRLANIANLFKEK
jgi:hypothetical protein